MLLETMVICSLTLIVPFYDCSEEWTIYIYDNDADEYCGKDGVLGCATWGREKNIYLSLDYIFMRDYCGYNVLEHEINHLKYHDYYYCHPEVRLIEHLNTITR